MALYMSNQRPLIALFGGTFDPIHLGHLHIAKQVYRLLPTQIVHFIPCNQPPHRATPQATAQDRLAMVQLAIQPYPYFVADDQEIKREGTSYTVDTLKTLRADHQNARFGLIIGSDAFSQFHQWHQWQLILQLTHLIVINRPGYNTLWTLPLANLEPDHKTANLLQLIARPAGGIHQLIIPPSPISASSIREKIHNKQDVSNFLPATVLDYIQQHRLYN